MADEVLKRDQNRITVIAGIDNATSEIVQARVEQITKRLLTQIQALSVLQDSLLIYANTLKDGTGTNYVPVVNSDGELIVDTVSGATVADTPEFFEDTNFVTGDSPVILDLNTALGRNATQGYIINDGAGIFTVSFSTNGTAFGDEITMKKNEVLEFNKISVDSLRVTWVSDSAYRISFI